MVKQECKIKNENCLPFSPIRIYCCREFRCDSKDVHGPKWTDDLTKSEIFQMIHIVTISDNSTEIGKSTGFSIFKLIDGPSLKHSFDGIYLRKLPIIASQKVVPFFSAHNLRCYKMTTRYLLFYKAARTPYKFKP